MNVKKLSDMAQNNLPPGLIVIIITKNRRLKFDPV